MLVVTTLLEHGKIFYWFEFAIPVSVKFSVLPVSTSISRGSPLALILIVVFDKLLNEADVNAQGTEMLLFFFFFFYTDFRPVIFFHMKNSHHLSLGMTSKNAFCPHRKNKCSLSVSGKSRESQG